MYRIHQIKRGIYEEKSVLKKKLSKKLRVPEDSIKNIKIIKESIDARDKKNIHFVYTIDFDCSKNLSIPKAPDMTYCFMKGSYPKEKQPVVVGFGPCGIFAALTLVQMGYKPLIIERGKSIKERDIDVNNFWQKGELDENSNIQFGEGGAGAFSDGKLTTGIKDVRIRKVLEELHGFGAPDEILYKQKAHIGTDLLKKVVANIREYIISKGATVRFSSQVTGITMDGSALAGLEITDTRQNTKEKIECDRAIFAIGHSARDTFAMLHDLGIKMEQKAFSIGVRIQHPQEVIDKAQYGDASLAKVLGAADYKLSCKTKNSRGVYTFCMCPGGEVILASSGKGQVVTNGMSYHARDGKYANSALLVDVRKEDFESAHVLAGVKFQEKYERLAYQVNNKYDFVKTTYKELENSRLNDCLPDFAIESIKEAIPIMAKKLKGFDMPGALLMGVETRSSSPVRILRDENMQASIRGIYPAGEGAGYAGGIMSAAVDGIKAAEHIVK